MQLMSKRTRHESLILLTDGTDRGSRTTLGKTIERVQRADTLVYSISFGSDFIYLEPAVLAVANAAADTAVSVVAPGEIVMLIRPGLGAAKPERVAVRISTRPKSFMQIAGSFMNLVLWWSIFRHSCRGFGGHSRTVSGAADSSVLIV
jgi:hypothetical protein